MLIQHTNFPVRPKMSKGESVAGYVSRYHGSNGHWVPRALHDALRSLYRGHTDKVLSAFEAVQAIIGSANPLDRSWWLDRPLAPVASTNQQRALPKLRYTPTHLCSSCLRDSGFHFAFWELSLVQACPIHRCYLSTACSTCGHTRSWSNITPNWSCPCGTPIMTAPMYPASSNAINLATLILNAADVILPPSYQVHISEWRRSEDYRICDVYGALAWAQNFRKILLKFGRNGRSRSRLIKSHGNAWEVKLLSDLPDMLYRRLQVALKHRFIGNKSLLVYIPEDDGFTRAQQFLHARKTEGDVFSKKLNAVLEQYLEEHQLALPVYSTVLFHPGVAISERNTRLSAFASWWFALSNQIGVLDPDARMSQCSIEAELTCKKARALHDMRIVRVLEALLAAAHLDSDIRCFRALTHWWRVPIALQCQMAPDVVLIRIGEHLTTMRVSELEFVSDLLADARKRGGHE